VRPLLLPVAGLLAVLLATPGAAEERGRKPKAPPVSRAKPPPPVSFNPDFSLFEEEAAPDPPLLRVDFGVVGWVENRTEIRSDRFNQVGTQFEDLEQEQGLASAGAAPWIELTIGGRWRGGADASWFVRGGERLKQQEERAVFDGVVLAEPGDYLRTSFQLLTCSGFVQWDALYARTYRLGLVGGVRYFRLDATMEGVRRQLPHSRSVRVRGELLSPFFGGHVELTPFPYLSVLTKIQFMAWSWEKIGLKEARYFEFRLAATLHVIPELLSLTVEYRFRVIRVEARANTTRARRILGGMQSNGLVFGVSLRF
jgi:hypothetical protein